MPGSFEGEAGNEGLGLEEERALHGAGIGGFALQAFALGAFVLEEPGVLDGDGDMSGEGFEDLDLVFRECVQFAVVDAENADDTCARFERDGDFGAGFQFAADVVGILVNVGSVAHAACGGDVADHALDADLEALAFLVFGAAANTLQNHLFAVTIAEPDVDLDVADGVGDVVDDAVEERVEVKRGGDEIGGALELHEDLRELAGGLNAGREGVTGLGGCRECGHEGSPFAHRDEGWILDGRRGGKMQILYFARR